MVEQDGGIVPSLTWEQAEAVSLPRRSETIIRCTAVKRRVYVSFVQDRHTDPEIKVFADSDIAIAYTRKRFVEVVAHSEDIQEYGLPPGWLLNLGYIESDRAFVMDTCLLDSEIA